MKANLFALVAGVNAFGTAVAYAETRAPGAIAIGYAEPSTRPAIFASVALPISRGIYTPHYQAAPGNWQDVAVKMWVPARWTLSRNRWGFAGRVFEPAHFAFVTNRVWVASGAPGNLATCRQ